MALEATGYVPFPRERVWERFARPGGITRLIPGFMGLRVLQEARPLSSGTAILQPMPPSPLPAAPFVPKWVAQHDSSAFVEGERFLDRVESAPYKQLFGWAHDHRLEDVEGGTQVVDILHGRIPERLVAPMFAFRRVQLTEDLRALDRARAISTRTMTIAMTGASGLIGTQLAAFLTTAGHRVIRLVRGTPTGPDERHWAPEGPAVDLLDGVDVVVHLAGSSIAGRFTAAHKRKLRLSRIEPTRLLAHRAGRMGATFVSASAIGYYGADRGDELLGEQASPGDDFVADVVRDWERAAQPATDLGIRAVQVRTGLVLAGAGGVLGMLSPLFRLGLGGAIGTGQQWYSWIALDDVVDVYVRAILDETMSGPVNAVAPNAVRNDEYTRTLGAVLHRPTPLPVPDFAPHIVLGKEGAEQLAQANQHVVPAALQERGHVFRFPELVDAVRHELGRDDT